MTMKYFILKTRISSGIYILRVGKEVADIDFESYFGERLASYQARAGEKVDDTRSQTSTESVVMPFDELGELEKRKLDNAEKVLSSLKIDEGDEEEQNAYHELKDLSDRNPPGN